MANPAFGWSDTLFGPKKGVFCAERDGNYAGLVYKLVWAKTGGSRDDDKFFCNENDFLPTHQQPQ